MTPGMDDNSELRLVGIFVMFVLGLITFSLLVVNLSDYDSLDSNNILGRETFTDDYHFGRFMDDEALVKSLKLTMLKHPTDTTEHITNKPIRSKIDFLLWSVMGKKVNGVFMDFGAGDGIRYSRTLWLEETKNWNGILIEANPLMKPRLNESGRKAKIFSSCLGLQKYPYIGALGLRSNYGSRLLDDDWIIYETIVDVDCYPMYTYFLAAGYKSVDLLVLDINGREINALKTTPWSKVDIKALLVRYVTRDDVTEIVNYLTKESRILYEFVYYVESISTYLYFVQSDIFRKYKQQDKRGDRDKRTSRFPE
ncbi:protein Star-like [Cimex lectularius]|uniref:Methyltransferase FkbM domain-containing protein n=1 Tax=Cimex lectularius TaxID=79782 RepID=A0A8I6R7M7_CIMLE|nr:protein Star-like [Cimex lectularius]